MNIEKLPSGSYRVQKIYKGVRYRVTFDHKPTQKEITIVLAEKMQNVSSCENGTFEKYANTYIENRRRVISPATVHTYNKHIKSISEEFKSMNINDIDCESVQIEVNNFAKGHAPKTVKALHGFISSVLGAYRPNLKLTTKLPQAIQKEDYDPTTDDIKRILDDSIGTRYHVPFQLAVLGVRRGELTALDISDLEGNNLRIHRSKVYIDGKWVVKESPKTDSSNRIIPLPENLASQIREQGVIFDGHPNALNKAIHRAQNRLGIPQFKFHKMRSYFASYAHSLGISDADIMSLGGWATDGCMKRVYRKSLEESKKESMKKISDSLLRG